MAKPKDKDTFIFPGGNNEFHHLLKRRVDQLDKDVVWLKADNVKLRAEIQATSQKALIAAVNKGFERLAKAIENLGGLTNVEEKENLEGLKALVQKLQGTGKK